MWRQSLVLEYPNLPAYQGTDLAFITEGDNAIDMFGQIFSEVTLVATTGGNIPNFNQNFTVPPGFTAFCPNPSMGCAATASILSYFEQPTVGGANAKATQTSGMDTSRAIVSGNAGIARVKVVSLSTAQPTTTLSQVLGGSQFNTSFSNAPVGRVASPISRRTRLTLQLAASYLRRATPTGAFRSLASRSFASLRESLMRVSQCTRLTPTSLTVF
jgi:hypothetical protein